MLVSAKYTQGLCVFSGQAKNMTVWRQHMLNTAGTQQALALTISAIPDDFHRLALCADTEVNMHRLLGAISRCLRLLVYTAGRNIYLKHALWNQP